MMDADSMLLVATELKLSAVYVGCLAVPWVVGGFFVPPDFNRETFRVQLHGIFSML